VACVGHAALDHVFEVEQIPGSSSKTLARRYQALAGGMALHASIAAARLGASVRLIGRVGEDAAAGARFITQRDHAPQQVPAPQVTAIDTTGAGDVFHAALAIALAERQAAHDAVRWACAAAAYKCAHGMGSAGAPTRAELDAWMRG